MSYYRRALGQAARGNLRTRELIAPILRNLVRTARKGDMPESRRYERMATLMAGNKGGG
jgi:hypothetical protein